MLPADWYADCRSFEYRGCRIVSKSAGDGPALLLIHGFPTASWDWCRVWPALQSHYRLVTCDMVGFGRSDKPVDYDYSIFDQADLMERLATEYDIDRAHLLAHDYGDTVAQELLARARESKLGFELTSCCFLNGGLIPGSHRPTVIQNLLASRIGPLVARVMSRRRFDKSFSRIFGEATRPSTQELDACWSLIEYNHGRRVIPRVIQYMRERIWNRERWVGVLSSPVVPMRLIDGAEDPISGIHVAEAYRRIVPEADVVVLDGIGHYPQLEAPDRVSEAALEFFDRHAQSR